MWACDFLQLYDVWFHWPPFGRLPRCAVTVGLTALVHCVDSCSSVRPIFACFIVDVNTKRVVHVGVTRAPTEDWTAQQLREVTPFGKGPQVLIRDGDTKYGAAFDRVA